MIVLEFIIFVVSSGLFYNASFRHRLWAVLIAGGIATGSSLLFVYDVYEKLTAKPEAPVKVVTEKKVPVPVLVRVSRPAALSRPENCRKDYPFFARIFGDEGTTELSFTVGADGALSDMKVSKSSGSDRLDDAAVDCVKKWHYRPALKDNELVDSPMTVSVAWNLDDEDDADKRPDEGKGPDAGKKPDAGGEKPGEGPPGGGGG
ncbi:MAG: energy transducer TonB [Alphaproteobacteria bacterium]|nr:energy transducer TonB [Alphaproteobacteria bacterium]